MKKKMKIRLSSVDVLQIVKALKCGWLDTDQITSFRSLVDGYNPPKEINSEELNYYLDCLYKGCGYVPTDQQAIQEMMVKGFDSDLQEKWERQIGDGSIYKRMVKDAFEGMVAVRALGGTFTDKEPDFSFVDSKPPKF